jgi:hypothetical protein
MCKHVAAVLYGIGARLDEQPELLFTLRRVDKKELIAKAGRGLPLSRQMPAEEKVLAADGLAELFGLELGPGEDDSVPGPASPLRKTGGRRRPAKAATPIEVKPAPRRASKTTRKKTPRSRTRPKAPPGVRPSKTGRQRRDR